MLKGKQRIAATHIEHSQAQQKEQHNNKLPLVTNEFKVGNKVLLHRTKAEKQWSGKFENKWDGPFFIHKVLGNRSYKLKLDNKILAKVAHGDCLKHYNFRNNPKPLIPQIELLKLALRRNLLLTPINIPPNATIQQKLQLCFNEKNSKYTPIYRYFYIRKILYKQKLELRAANLTKEAIQKQLYNEFKTTAGSTNSHYKLRAAFRLYDLFHTCENVLQNPILQPLKIQYIGKLTKLKFQKFSDQISSIILDYYLEITDSTWILTEFSLEEEVMLLNEIRNIA
ncbi:hypothetical protein G9A89_007753 [Geosiphon pyriformis]|nr:hypothetical protein G9A89_007753 [Geosiphon pyriformis]